ncbi:EI24 domain-containing protein [Amnibacterium sp. CER49]|uniref:EI24 domain-containing protein n=1 Tax=Amnibacterium sp. CER49 TaxID=3039161 RepID=UPI0024481C64|nr:EI24 domain-containing protein [Amnibacterium sp. CER49]MDH2444484.1 EI24 domain-containing protein [Amnibacterium sp. CER49]
MERARPSFARDVGAGVRDLLGGFRAWATSPALLLLGAVPALVVLVAFAGVVVLLLVLLPGIVAGATPFADPWAPGLRDAVRALLAVALLVVAGVVLVLAYAAVTVAVGDPCYERIARRVDETAGRVPPEPHVPLLRGVARAVGDGARLLVAGLAVGLVSFVLGLVPVAGPVLAAVWGAVAGGWLLAVELTGYAFEARGHRLRERRRVLRSRPGRALGFGVPVALLLLVPLGAVVVMPAAVAGATLLARGVLGEPRGRGVTPSAAA